MSSIPKTWWKKDVLVRIPLRELKTTRDRIIMESCGAPIRGGNLFELLVREIRSRLQKQGV